MVMGSSPRRIAILTGLGSLALILFAATVGRKEIATQYHLLRLRTDPAYFRGILDQRDGTPQKAAVRKYLESVDGKCALIRECLPPSRQMLFRGFTAEQVPRVYIDISIEQIRLSVESGTVLWHDVLVKRLNLIREYVSSGFTFTLSEYSGVKFEMRNVLETRL